VTCSTRSTRPASDFKSRCADGVEALQAGITTLLGRAVDVGAVRDDVDAGEVVALIIGACHARESIGGNAESVQRLVGVVCGVSAGAPKPAL